jgi:hypothetical protein
MIGVARQLGRTLQPTQLLFRNRYYLKKDDERFVKDQLPSYASTISMSATSHKRPTCSSLSNQEFTSSETPYST